jgi:hypothetical protein
MNIEPESSMIASMFVAYWQAAECASGDAEALPPAATAASSPISDAVPARALIRESRCMLSPPIPWGR